MKPKVYIETSVISYLTSPPPRDVVALGRQEVTRRWWETRRSAFCLLVSPVVLEEARQGDPGYAFARMNVMTGIPVVQISDQAHTITAALIREKALPQKAAVDELHIAIAADALSQFLLTWNFRHIANAQMRSKSEAVLIRSGVRPPLLCTPDQLPGDAPSNLAQKLTKLPNPYSTRFSTNSTGRATPTRVSSTSIPTRFAMRLRLARSKHQPA